MQNFGGDNVILQQQLRSQNFQKQSLSNVEIASDFSAAKLFNKVSV